MISPAGNKMTLNAEPGGLWVEQAHLLLSRCEGAAPPTIQDLNQELGALQEQMAHREDERAKAEAAYKRTLDPFLKQHAADKAAKKKWLDFHVWDLASISLACSASWSRRASASRRR